MARWAAVAALCVSACVAWLARDVPHLGYFHDDSIYIVSAESLAEGAGYRIRSLPGEPHQTKYPPLYPALLALTGPFPGSLPFALGLTWIALPACVLLTRRLYAGFGVTAAWALAAVLAVSPYMTLAGISLLSELPFTALALAALLLVDRRPALAGALAGAACLTRSAGIVLLVAAVLRLRRRSLPFAAAMLPPVIAWFWWAAAHRDGAYAYYTDYLGHYLGGLTVGDVVTYVYRNSDMLLLSTGGLFFFGLDDSFLAKSIARVAAVVAFAGLARSARNGVEAWHWFAAAHIALLLVWNYPPDQRFLVPVFPMLLAGFYTEARNLWNAARNVRIVRAAFALVAAAAVGTSVAGITVALPSFLKNQRALRDERVAAYRWIGANVAGDAQFLAYSDAVLYLHTRRRAQRAIVPPRLVYRGELPAVQPPSGLTHAFLTDVDMDLEFRASDRGRAQSALASGLRLTPIYTSSHARVCTIALDDTIRPLVPAGGTRALRR